MNSLSSSKRPVLVAGIAFAVIAIIAAVLLLKPPKISIIRESSLSAEDGEWLKGTVPEHETVIRLANSETTLLKIDLRITDSNALDTALLSLSRTTVAGRDGYIVPMNDAGGGTGFAMIGKTSIVLIQHGKSYLWPGEPETEVAAYLKSLRVQ